MAGYNFSTLPVPGESGNAQGETWGEILNKVLTEFKTVLNNQKSDIEGKAESNHSHTGNDINLEGGNLTQVIESLSQGLVSIGTAVGNMPTNDELTAALSPINDAITDLQNKISFFAVDLNQVNIAGQIGNAFNGINIRCFTTEGVQIPYWQIEIKKNNLICYTSVTSNSFTFVNADSVNLEDGDNLTVKITAISQNNTKSKEFAHQYRHQATPLQTQVEEIQQNLTLDNFVNAFIQNPGAVNALANAVHGSKLLAQNISDIQNASN